MYKEPERKHYLQNIKFNHIVARIMGIVLPLPKEFLPQMH